MLREIRQSFGWERKVIRRRDNECRKKRGWQVQSPELAFAYCLEVGLFCGNTSRDEKEQQKKTPVSDEVTEIENLNARDHVLDLNHLFEEEDVTWKEKRALKKNAQKQAEMSDGKKKSADKKKDTKKDTEKKTEGKSEVPQKPNEEPQQPQEPNGEPEVPQQPQGPNEEPEAPQEPQGPNEEPEVPQQPQGPNEEPEAPQQPQEPEVPQKPTLPQVSEPGWITGIY